MFTAAKRPKGKKIVILSKDKQLDRQKSVNNKSSEDTREQSKRNKRLDALEVSSKMPGGPGKSFRSLVCNDTHIHN